MASVELHSISPVPSDEEAAAIAAALEWSWPRPVVVLAAEQPKVAGAWRWSGRWWTDRGVPASRRRP